MSITKRKIGINFNNGIADIFLWAPTVKNVRLLYGNNQAVDLERQPYGYWFGQTASLLPETDYIFELTTANGIFTRADPASLSQPYGVHGASRTIDTKAHQFKTTDWKGVPLKDFIIYEVHTATFSPEGTFQGIIQKLDHLLDLGITAIEIMPVAAFPGERNWGYDGVFPFAVQESYGGPLALQQLVDACHEKGLAVILDVVYNHFGPEGNYFEDFGPYFTERYQTPWGKAINFDDRWCDGVRNFFVENALMWLRDFRIDALRLDAVHAIKDFGAVHLLTEIQLQVKKLNDATGRQHHLIIECDLNDPKMITPISHNGIGMDAQWIDEFHHALRVAAGQPKEGYYADFNGVLHLAKSYQDAYVYDGNYSAERKRHFGKPATSQLGAQFVVFSQNHDQVGNRMLGERSSQLYSHEMLKLLAGAIIISPYLPLLFMGEEWGETNPFLYFVSHTEPALVEAVRKGRNEEFSAFHQGDAPDPQASKTFENSKLQWNLLSQPRHQQILTFYKDLIALRKADSILNRLDRKQLTAKAWPEQQCLVLHRWNNSHSLYCLLNFSKAQQQLNLPDNQNWEKVIDSSAVKYGGSTATDFNHQTQDLITVQPESIIIYRKNNG